VSALIPDDPSPNFMKKQHLAAGLFMLALMGGGARSAELRIGVIGLDTFHATQLTGFFNDPAGAGHVPGGRVVVAFRGGSPDLEFSRGRLPEVTRQMTEKFGVKLVDSIEELATQVDAILIESVDGRPHLEQFRRTLSSGRPVFIDKPLAGSLRDAVEIVRLARRSGTPCFSSSALRYSPNSPMQQPEKLGTVRSAFAYGPADIEPHHPDLFWYGIHAVEALYGAMGPGCVSVVRTHSDATDIVTGLWNDGRIGTAQGNRGHERKFGLTVFGARATLSGGDRSSLQPLAVKIMEFFQTRVAPVRLEETLELFAFMEAADESRRRGGARVTVAEVLKAAGADDRP
jgi:hypothetical protein